MPDEVAGAVKGMSAYRALAWAARWRAAHALAAMPMVLRAEIVALFVTAALLLAYHAGERYYGFDPLDPQATTVTQLSRVMAAVLVLSTAVLAHLSPRLYARAGDFAFLRAAPVPARAVAAGRADGLAVAALPLLAAGLGLLLPPVAFGQAWIVALAIPALGAWMWAASQALALVCTWSPEGRWGPGGVGGAAGRAARFVVVPAMGFAYFAGRELSALVLDPRGALSLCVTALLGVGLGAAARWAALAVARGSAWTLERVAEHQEILKWKRRRALRKQGPRLRLPVSGPLPAWVNREILLAARHRGLRPQWLLAFLLKAGVLALALGSRGDPPWALAGLLLVVSDVVVGVALLQHWSHEQLGWAWGSPSRKRTQWAARAVPALAVSLVASLGLAATAWARAGEHVARPLSLWTVVSGASLVLAAANLGPATPPRSALGQNLYGLGLVSAALVGAVYPVVGWAVLGLFALYTLRALARDPRP